MPEINHTDPSVARTIATPRQMRDRLDLLVAGLRHRVGLLPGALRRTATEALSLADELSTEPERAVALRAIGECDLADGRPEEAREALREALHIKEKHGDREGMARTLMALARAHIALRDTPEMHAALVRARDIYAELGDARGVVAAITALGNLYVGVGDLVRAVECFNAALVESATFVTGAAESESEGAEDLVQLGAVHNDLAHVHAALGDDAQAIELLTRALGLFERAGDMGRQAHALGALGALYDATGDAGAGLDASMRAALLMDMLHDRAGTARTMMTIAMIHERAGRPAEALGTMLKAFEQAEAAAAPALLGAVLVGMAGLERRSGRQWQAAARLERSIELLSTHGERSALYAAHELLAAVYEDVGAADKALDHYKAYMALHDALRGEEKQRAIAELEVRYSLAGAERDRELYRLQAERLQAELDGRSREFVSMTTGILQKNSALGLVLERMRDRFAGRNDAREALAALREEVDRLRDPADAWRTFEAGLDQLYPTFMSALGERHPDLSPTESKLCVLLRAEMTTRDIAALLYISERTVENHRYRLRRKLDLPPGMTLTAYLKSL